MKSIIQTKTRTPAPTQRKRIEELLAENPSEESVRDVLGVCPNTMRVYLTRLYPLHGVHSLVQLLLLISAPTYIPPTEKRFGDVLSPAEFEIIKLLSKGLSDRKIAEQRTVKVQTIRNMLASIRRKTGISARTELALTAHYQLLHPISKDRR